MSDTNSSIEPTTTTTTTTKIPRGRPKKVQHPMLLSAMEKIARHHLKSARSAATKAANKASRANEMVAEWTYKLKVAETTQSERIFSELRSTAMELADTEATTVNESSTIVANTSLALHMSDYDTSGSDDSDADVSTEQTDNTTTASEMETTIDNDVSVETDSGTETETFVPLTV
jgi:hypothetical protein